MGVAEGAVVGRGVADAGGGVGDEGGSGVADAPGVGRVTVCVEVGEMVTLGAAWQLTRVKIKINCPKNLAARAMGDKDLTLCIISSEYYTFCLNCLFYHGLSSCQAWGTGI